VARRVDWRKIMASEVNDPGLHPLVGELEIAEAPSGLAPPTMSVRVAAACVASAASTPIKPTEVSAACKRVGMPVDVKPVESLRDNAVSLEAPLTKADPAMLAKSAVDVNMRWSGGIAAGYEARKSAWDKIWEVAGKLFSVPALAAATLGKYAVSGMRWASQGALWLLASPAMIFNVTPGRLWRAVGKVTGPTFAAVSGLVEGVIRAPFSIAGTGCIFLKNLFGFGWVTSGAKAIETVFQPVIGVVFSVFSPLLLGFESLSDALSPGRPLTPEERASQRDLYPPEVLDRVRLVPAPSLFEKAFLPSAAGAFTLGDHIYFSEELGHIARLEAMQRAITANNYAPGCADNAALDDSSLSHEIVHTLQYRDVPGGIVGFLSTYVASALGNLATTFDPDAAYKRIAFEKDAYALQMPPENDADARKAGLPTRRQWMQARAKWSRANWQLAL